MAVNEVLGSLYLLKHPDKTFIGRIEKGFDFLGYHFGPEGLSVAARTFYGSSHVPSGFTSKSRGRLSPPPGSGCTCGVGSGGRVQGRVSHLELNAWQENPIR